MNRWKELANKTLVACQAILVSGVGENSIKIMLQNCIRVIQMSGFIED